VHSGTSKRKALECLQREIKILSECDHPNIAKILDSSFEGEIITEPIDGCSNATSLNANNSPISCCEKSESKSNEEMVQLTSLAKYKRKQNVCYYVMKLAEFGELFQFIEHTDRFSEKLSKSLFS
jgi:serine/threonine protein kinase